MNGSIFAIEARGSGAHRAPLSRAARIRRFAAGVVIAAMAMLGLQASPAWAAAAGDISKALDATQGQGYSLVNGEDTFQTGALVRYRLVVSCSSLDTACVTGTVTDVLDPNLEFVQVIAPVARNNDGQVMPIVTSTSGQTVTTVVGSAAAPLQGGNTIELVLVARVVSRPASGVIPNQATITVPGVAPVPSEIVTIHVPPPSPNYRITKQVISTQQDAALGEPVTYRVAFEGFQYDNVGIVLPFTITDTYPAGATVVNPAGGTVDGSSNLTGHLADRS